MYDQEYDEQELTDEERAALADQMILEKDEQIGEIKQAAAERKEYMDSAPEAADLRPDEAVGRSAAKQREEQEAEVEEEQPEEEEEEVDFSDRRISSVGPQTPPGIRKSFHTGT